jgi:nitrogen regulation protein NR(I)
MPTILLVDDEPNVLYSLEKCLRGDETQIITAGTARDGIEAVRQQQPDVVICDVHLPDMSGLDAFLKMREIDPRLPVIIITAHASTDVAIEAMKRGAFDYLPKPYDLAELQQTVARAAELSRLSRVPAVFDQSTPLSSEDSSVDRIVGSSRVMQEVYKEIGRVAPQDVNVLILGESGTGKELVARAIVQHSGRADGPFLAINCAAIPEALLESELFGHEKGAFTSAERRRIGKFEQADGGTLFLDEIGDMTLPTQAKVLRVLQDGCFERVGTNETLHADVRIVAATNQNLPRQIAEHQFREDLYYRLNTFTIRLPALRERRDDLPQLIEYFIRRFSRELNRDIQGVAPDAMELLQSFEWPGNVRELQSTIKYAIVRSTGSVITSSCLPDQIQQATPGQTATSVSVDPLSGLRALVQEFLQDGRTGLNEYISSRVDTVVLEEVLHHVAGNLSRAAEILGISRTTLRSRLQALGITVERTVRTDGQSET